MLDRLAPFAHRATIERNRRNGTEFLIGGRSGVWLHELGGERRLIDCSCSGGVFNLGHANAEISATIREALDAGKDGGAWWLPDASALGLAEAVVQAMPLYFPNRAVVTHSSTASIDLALMVAMRATKRSRFVACRNAYHGHTGFAAIVTDSRDEGVAEHYRLPRDRVVFFEFGDASELASALDTDSAALILEPMCYETFEAADPSFMRELFRICRMRGALVIMDETRTGLGRTGTLWGSERFDEAPNIMIVGKGLSGGLYPVSLCLMGEDLYDSAINSHDYGYASSLAGSEIACIVAKKVLELSAQASLLKNVEARAHQAELRIAALVRRFQRVVTGGGANGLAIHVRLSSADVARSLHRASFNNGVLCHSISTARGPMIKLMPPLIVTEVEIAMIFDRVEAALDGLLNASK